MKDEKSVTPLLDQLRKHPQMKKLLSLKLFTCEIDELGDNGAGEDLDERGLKRYKILGIEAELEKDLELLLLENESENVNYIDFINNLNDGLEDTFYVDSCRLEARLKLYEWSKVDGITDLIEYYLEEVRTDYIVEIDSYEYHKEQYDKLKVGESRF